MNPYYPDWMQYGACASIGGDVWYPDWHDQSGWSQAREVCRGCPMLHLCLDWVMGTELGVDYKHRHGIAAGMSPVERHKYEPEWLAGQLDGAA